MQIRVMSKPKAPSDAARLSDVKQLFIDCQKADDDAAREKVLCASNPVRADEVRQLLDGIDEGEFIDRVFDVTGIEEPADLNATEASHAESSRSSGPRSSSTSSERPGCVIGNYKLLEQIGEGGMGTVFMAQQTHPVKRRVAVKIVKPGMDSRQVVARF